MTNNQITLSLSSIEYDTILAAIRMYQANGYEQRNFVLADFEDIATNCGAHPAMSNEEIEELVEKMQHS